jgi:uncharacterized repeat protein (TIGR03803 family)
VTGCGVVYKLSPKPDGTWSETVLHAFVADTEGVSNPSTDVVFDAAGNLYGADYFSDIYELSPDGSGGWTMTKILYLNGSVSPGLQFRSGNLWFAREIVGMTGCGLVLYLTPPNPAITIAGMLPATWEDGCNIFGSPVFDAAGNFYVVTTGGGSDSLGTVVKFEAGTGTITVLHDFVNPGAAPASGLIMDSSGNLYGSVGGDTSSYPTVIYKISNP